MDLTRPHWRTVSLGSRKQLCINDEIRTKLNDLDEKCRELLGGQNNALNTYDKNADYLSVHRKERKPMS